MTSDRRPPHSGHPEPTGQQALPEVLRVRVAFADTDAMGVAWHGNYLRWFEMARTELMRPTELPYPALVGRGIHLPVIEALVRYRRPARYDDLLVVRVGRRARRRRARCASSTGSNATRRWSSRATPSTPSRMPRGASCARRATCRRPSPVSPQHTEADR